MSQVEILNDYNPNATLSFTQLKKKSLFDFGFSTFIKTEPNEI